MESRSIKELGQIMLDNKHLFENGLCDFTYQLQSQCIISISEEIIIDNFVYENSTRIDGSANGFIWPMENWDIREKWIKENMT